MKALVVEVSVQWRVNIRQAVLHALPFLHEQDVMPCADRELACQLLEGKEGWQYQLIFLDWGFVTGGNASIANSMDVVEAIRKHCKGAILIMITGADKDKGFLHNTGTTEADVLRTFLNLGAAETIFKHQISKKFPTADSGLPLLVKKLKDMRLNEKLNQAEVRGLSHQNDYLCITVHGVVFRFTPQQAILVKLLHEKRLDYSPGQVTKDEMRDALAKDSRFTKVARRTDWKPRETFAASVDGLKFWKKHIFRPASKGIYCLRIEGDDL